MKKIGTIKAVTPLRPRSGKAATVRRAKSQPKKLRSARMTPEARKQLIVDEAISYFAEVGFEAGTRALAARLGITQPLIFRYFPNKDDLVQAVYDRVFLSRWRAKWEPLLEDRTRPVRDRLIDFYSEYTDVIFHSEWMRIFLFAGLRSLDLNRWYIQFVEDRIHRRVCAEIRAESGIIDQAPISGLEMELLWTLHGGIFYHGVRRHAYGVPVHLEPQAFIAASVDCLLQGMPATILKARAG